MQLPSCPPSQAVGECSKGLHGRLGIVPRAVARPWQNLCNLVAAATQPFQAVPGACLQSRFKRGFDSLRLLQVLRRMPVESTLQTGGRWFESSPARQRAGSSEAERRRPQGRPFANFVVAKVYWGNQRSVGFHTADLMGAAPIPGTMKA